MMVGALLNRHGRRRLSKQVHLGFCKTRVAPLQLGLGGYSRMNLYRIDQKVQSRGIATFIIGHRYKYLERPQLNGTTVL